MSNVARDAIDVLKNNGWGKGRYYYNNKYCAIGALAQAMHPGKDIHGFDTRDVFGEAENSPAGQKLAETFAEQFPERNRYPNSPYVPDLNDHSDTTMEDVIMVFEKVAVWIDEQA